MDSRLAHVTSSWTRFCLSLKPHADGRMLQRVRAHRVVQPVDVEDYGLGSLVTGAQEELGFPAGADGLLGRL